MTATRKRSEAPAPGSPSSSTCSTICLLGTSKRKSRTPKVEAFYWATILFSNTLGTALGDFTSDDSGLGYLGSAAFFSGLLLILALIYATGRVSNVLLFWAAFVLTRPLGATLGDFLTKPIAHGGLDLSRGASSAVLAVCMVAAVIWCSCASQAGTRLK